MAEIHVQEIDENEMIEIMHREKQSPTFGNEKTTSNFKYVKTMIGEEEKNNFSPIMSNIFVKDQSLTAGSYPMTGRTSFNKNEPKIKKGSEILITQEKIDSNSLVN